MAGAASNGGTFRGTRVYQREDALGVHRSHLWNAFNERENIAGIDGAGARQEAVLPLAAVICLFSFEKPTCLLEGTRSFGLRVSKERMRWDTGSSSPAAENHMCSSRRTSRWFNRREHRA